MTARRFKDEDGQEWEVTEGLVGFIEGPPSPVLRFRGLAPGGGLHWTSSAWRVGDISEEGLQRALDRAKRGL